MSDAALSPRARERRKNMVVPAAPGEEKPSVSSGRRTQVQGIANLDVILRNEHDKMHAINSKPKRSVSVEVTSLAAPDAHAWLHTHEKEISKMRDLFGRKSNQPAPPQIVSYVDARFCQIKSISQLEVTDCTLQDRRNGISVARQLSKAKRLKDKGIKIKQDEEQSSGSKMCDDITNLLLSVGIHDEGELEENKKKQRMQRAKMRAKLKSRAVSAFSTALRSPVEKARDSLVSKLRDSARQSSETSPHEGSGGTDDKEGGDSRDGAEHGVDEKIMHAEKLKSPDEEQKQKQKQKQKQEEAAKKKEENPESEPDTQSERPPDAAKGSGASRGLIHGIAHAMHLTESTHPPENGSAHVPPLDLSQTGQEGPDGVVLPSSFRGGSLEGTEDGDDHDGVEAETDYANLAYSSDESEDNEGELNVEESDEEIVEDENGGVTPVSEKKDKRKVKEHNDGKIMFQGVLEARKKARQSMKHRRDKGEEGVLGSADEGGHFHFAPKLQLTMAPSMISWEEELAHLYYEIGTYSDLADVEEEIRTHKGGELEHLLSVAELAGSDIPIRQKIRLANLQWVVKRPRKDEIDWIKEIEHFYLSVGKVELVDGVQHALEENTGNELHYLTRLAQDHVHLLPPNSQEIERIEGLRRLLAQGKPLKPIGKPIEFKFKFGYSGRVHDIRNALYINPLDIDWKGEVGHLYITLDKPDKLKNLDEMVETNKGAEINIIRHFQSNYGHSLPLEELARLKSLEFILQKPSIMWDFTMIDWRAELSTFYISVGRSDKLHVIDDICATNKGIEATLVVHLLEEYAKVLHPQIATRFRALKDIAEKPGTYRRIRDIKWRAELSSFFLTIGHPERLGDVEAMLEKNKGKEADLFAHLCDKYRHDTPESLTGHLVNIGKMIERERLGLEYEDAFEDLQLVGQNYDKNRTASGHMAVHIIDLSLNRFRFLDFSQNMSWSVNNVVALNLSGNLLISLDGIDACKQLRFLDCNDNLLSSMTALRKCRMLRHLKISGNRLTSLSFLTPEEMAIAEDPEEHSKAMLDDRRKRQGTYKSARATTFFQTHFGTASRRQEVIRTALMPSPRGSPRLLAAMLASARSAKRNSQAKEMIYHEPDDIDYQQELATFYTAVNMRDKLPGIPALVQSAAGAEVQMLETMHEKYSKMERRIEDAESGVPSHSGAAFDRLLQLVAILKCNTEKYPIIAVNASTEGEDEPPAIRWEEELSLFYRAAGLHDKVGTGVVEAVLGHHEGHEDTMVTNVLNKYREEEMEEGEDKLATSADSAAAVVIPRCARRRLAACKEALENWRAENSRRQGKKSSWGFSLSAAKKDPAPTVLQDSPRPASGNASSPASAAVSASGTAPASAANTAVPSATTTHNNSASSSVVNSEKEKVLSASASEQTLSSQGSKGTDSTASSSPNKKTDTVISSKPNEQRHTSDLNINPVLHPSIVKMQEAERKSGTEEKKKMVFDMPHLEYLNASENSSLENLEGLRYFSHLSLRHLELQQCNLRDEHLHELEGLPLTTLYLDNNRISNLDVTLPTLSTLANLRNLSLLGNPVQGREDDNSVVTERSKDRELSSKAANQQSIARSITEKLVKRNAHGLGDSADDLASSAPANVDAVSLAIPDEHLARKVASGGNTTNEQDRDDASATSGVAEAAQLPGGLVAIDSNKLPMHHKLHHDTLRMHQEMGGTGMDPSQSMGQRRKSGPGQGVSRDVSLMSQLTTTTDGSSPRPGAEADNHEEKGDVQVMKKSLYSISILDNIDTLDTLDHLVVPPSMYSQLRRMKAQVEGEGILSEIERYYSAEMMSMDDVHKNLAQKHRRSESLIKAIVKDKTARIEEEMSALMKFARSRLLTLRSNAEPTSIYDKAVDPKDVIASVKGEFSIKMRQREHTKKRVEEARIAKAQAEDEKLRQKGVDGMIASISGKSQAVNDAKAQTNQRTAAVGFANEAESGHSSRALAAPKSKITFDDLKD